MVCHLLRRRRPRPCRDGSTFPGLQDGLAGACEQFQLYVVRVPKHDHLKATGLSEGANCPAPLMIRKLALPMQRASLSDSPPIANGSYSPVSRYTSTGQLGDPGQGVAEGSVADEELRQGSDAFADSVFGVGHALPAWRGAMAADLVMPRLAYR